MAWYNGYQVWLTETQSLANAQNIINYFLSKENHDWTNESISALIGNMRHESSVNPNMYEYGYEWVDDRGYGLVQWTPRSKFWDWATAQGLDPEKPESQLARIDYEVEQNIQWFANRHELGYGGSTKYDFSFATFRQNSNNLTVEQLTEAFMWNYEAPAYTPAINSLPERQAFAKKVLNTLNFDVGGDTGGGDTGGGENQDGGGNIIDDIENGINEIINNFSNQLTEVVNVRMYSNNTDKQFLNSFLKIEKEMDNVYKLSPNTDFNDLVSNSLGGLLGNSDYQPPDPDPEPEPDPDPPTDTKHVFPVDYTRSGINFWVGKYDMDYGWRSMGWHAGYDIGGGGASHPIYAVQSGIVTWSGYKSGGIGNCIYIDHDVDVYHSNYMHLSTMDVSIGDTITKGQKIGMMGASGGDYAIHLHFELSEDGTFHSAGNTLDPKQYLGIISDNNTSLRNPTIL